MNHYETIFIVDLDTPEADQETIFEKLKSTIDQDGKLIMFDDWGTKKFAYEIRKKKTGRYVRLDYCGNGELVDVIERLFRLDYRILKYMTVLLATDVDPESLIIEPEEPEADAGAKKSESTEETAATEETSEEKVSEESPEESTGETVEEETIQTETEE